MFFYCNLIGQCAGKIYFDMVILPSWLTIRYKDIVIW